MRDSADRLRLGLLFAAPGITQEAFWNVTLTALLITVLVTIGFWAPNRPPRFCWS